MSVAVARARGAELNRSFRAALYQAARHNVSTRRGGHQDRIRRRSQARCSADNRSYRTYRTYNMFLLEAEPKRRVDATLVSRIGCSKPTKAAGRRRRLTKQQRSQVADRIGEVRVIQNVLEVQRERQIVTASAATARTTEATTASAWSTKPTTTATATTARSAAAAWTTRTSPGHTAAHHRAVTSIALL